MGLLRRLFSQEDEDPENGAARLSIGKEGSLKRVLVLGSALQSRSVTSFEWDNLPSDLNVADYDVVILNFVPFSEDQELAGGINSELLPTRAQFARLVFSQESEVIAIGVPGTEIGFGVSEGNEEVGRVRRLPLYLSFRSYVTWWLPAIPRVVHEAGQEIRDVEEDFEFYFRCVRAWSFYVTNEWHDNLSNQSYYNYIREINPRGTQLSGSLRSVASTRFQQAIAFELRFRVLREKRIIVSGQEPFELLDQSSRIIWLPPPTTITSMDAVELILRERYALGVEQAPPDWVQMYPLPNEGPFEEEIRRHELEVLDLQEQLSLAHRRLDEQQRFRGLLYEQGEEVLEPIVRDALRALGAHVQEPQQRGREDGRLTDPFGRSAMLEIKGRSGVLRLSDVRQLQDWTSDAVAQEDWSGKGILIANLRCSDPPNERSDVFPDNAKQAAERFQQCLFTTTQLFRALRAHQRGELALQDFWDTIFNTEGVCELPDLEEPAAGTDDTS